MTDSRRSLATRHAASAITLARWLALKGVRPNAVSIAGIAFAGLSASAFIVVPTLNPEAGSAALLAAVAGIQLRLLCNLLDGMLAVEEGLGTSTGAIFNEIPDRIADILILCAAGYSARELPYGITLGWSAAMAAVMTAYIRVFGGSIGTAQPFIGPMAKQHRMFVLTVAALGNIAEVFAGAPPRAMRIGLAVIVVGSIVTAIRRTRRIAAEVAAR